jgi:hypothetical protein
VFGGKVVARRARGLGYSSCGCHLWKKHGFPKPRGEGGVPFNVPTDRQSWVSFDAVTSSVRLIDRGFSYGVPNSGLSSSVVYAQGSEHN